MCWPMPPTASRMSCCWRPAVKFRSAFRRTKSSKAEGVKARVVSMPSWEVFEHQPPEYRASVLPPDITARVAVEQASTFGWARYTGLTGQIIGMRTFGASAPLKELLKEFNFTAEAVVAAAKAQLQKPK